MELCQYCIEAIRSRHEPVYVGEKVYSVDDEQKCEWCDEVDDLYECSFEKGD